MDRIDGVVDETLLFQSFSVQYLVYSLHSFPFEGLSVEDNHGLAREC